MSVEYRAFLSYSHKDTAFARSLHRSLEHWKVATDLVGRTTTAGIVPQTLRPIFRDRDDFAGGASLQEATINALEKSKFLIVLCSPNSAKSKYVDAEVRIFKQLGRAHRIIPVIIAGEPGSDDNDCFPPSVIHEVDEAGELTEIPTEPIAADAREEGDGRHRATAKIVAGLLGVTFDEIARREERAQRRRTRIVGAVAIVMAVLALLSGYLAWLADARRIEAERNFNAAKSAADSLLGDIGGELIRIKNYPHEKKRQVLRRAEIIYDRLLESTGRDLGIVASRAESQLIFAVAFSSGEDLEASFRASEKAREGFSELLAFEPDVAKWWVRRAVSRLISLISVTTLPKPTEATGANRPHPAIIRREAMADIGQARKLGGANDELYHVQAMLNLAEASSRFASKDYERAVDFITIALQNMDAIETRFVELSWSEGANLKRHAYNKLAEIHLARGALHEALTARKQQIEHIKLKIADEPSNEGPHKELGEAYQSIAQISRDLHLPLETAAAQRKAGLANFYPKLLTTTDTERLIEHAQLAHKHAEAAAGVLDFENNRAKAIEWYFVAAALYERLIDLGIDELENALVLQTCLNQLGWLHFNDKPERETAALVAVEFARKLGRRFPEERMALGYAIIDLGEVYSSTERLNEAVALYQEAIEIFASAPNHRYAAIDRFRKQAFSWMRIARIYSQQGDSDGALVSVLAARNVLESGIKEHPSLREQLVLAISQIAPHQQDPENKWRRIIELLNDERIPLTDVEISIRQRALEALKALE